MNAEQLAKLFHDTYEFLAPSFGYKTREASAVAWDEVPDQNKKLMIAVAEKILLAMTGNELTDQPMTNKEYIKLAMRTETPADPLADRIYSRLLHSALGCANDSGELVVHIKDRLFYNKPLDTISMLEEYGDLLWFIVQGVDALGATLEEVMEMNIDKLRARYPEKFTADKAINRDLDAERAALEET